MWKKDKTQNAIWIGIGHLATCYGKHLRDGAGETPSPLPHSSLWMQHLAIHGIKKLFSMWKVKKICRYHPWQKKKLVSRLIIIAFAMNIWICAGILIRFATNPECFRKHSQWDVVVKVNAEGQFRWPNIRCITKTRLKCSWLAELQRWPKLYFWYLSIF